MNKFLFFISSLIVSVSVSAKGFNFILANPPGSSSDFVARTVAKAYNELTGNKLILHHLPGGDHILAVQKFVSSTQPVVLLGSTTMHIFNPVFKSSLPYSDSDFDHVAWIGSTPHIWYVRRDSKYQSFSEVNLAINNNYSVTIGVDAQSTQVNVVSIQKSRPENKNITMVPYKGSPQVLADILGGHIDMAVSSLSNALVNLAAEGQIRILASTSDRNIMINSVEIPMASKYLRTAQFDGGFLLSINSNFRNTEENKQLKKDLTAAIKSDYVKQELSKINIIVDIKNSADTMHHLMTYRDRLQIIK